MHATRPKQGRVSSNSTHSKDLMQRINRRYFASESSSHTLHRDGLSTEMRWSHNSEGMAELNMAEGLAVRLCEGEAGLEL